MANSTITPLGQVLENRLNNVSSNIKSAYNLAHGMSGSASDASLNSSTLVTKLNTVSNNVGDAYKKVNKLSGSEIDTDKNTVTLLAQIDDLSTNIMNAYELALQLSGYPEDASRNSSTLYSQIDNTSAGLRLSLDNVNILINNETEYPTTEEYQNASVLADRTKFVSNCIDESYTVITSKGGTVPDDDERRIDELPNYIGTIPQDTSSAKYSADLNTLIDLANTL